LQIDTDMLLIIKNTSDKLLHNFYSQNIGSTNKQRIIITIQNKHTNMCGTRATESQSMRSE